MKARTSHINNYLAFLMLLVFVVSLAPLGLLHHHEVSNSCQKGEVRCTHKEHIRTHAENCLICALHFEKTYTTNRFEYQVFLQEKRAASYFSLIGSCYTALVRSSLRGPPSVYASLS